MTTVAPLKFSRVGSNELHFSDETGRFFRADNDFLDRLVSDTLSRKDRLFLESENLLLGLDGRANISTLSRLSKRLTKPSKPNYLILVPTLRCDLRCSYCQVSRANLNAKGYDWTDAMCEQVCTYIDNVGGDDIQIEFQGGEPTLRSDLLTHVMDFARGRFKTARFIICTNLSNLSDEIKAIYAMDDVYISTSFDGTLDLHRQQRLDNDSQLQSFERNIAEVLEIAPGRVSALPTLNPKNLPNVSDLLSSFDALGMRSIFLRPIVYHGFAKKAHSSSRNMDDAWWDFYRSCIDAMIDRNGVEEGAPFEDYYLTHIIKRMLRPGENGHFDLRSGSWLGYGHQVIDFDGTIYPSDEARMMARTGQVDLSIGDVVNGIDLVKRSSMQSSALNMFDPWCRQCPYSAACGSDPIDDIARYGRTDLAKPLTAFCQRHTRLFELAGELIYSNDLRVQSSLAKWLELPSPVSLGARLA